jgi:DHA2 family multidrug resistance protein
MHAALAAHVDMADPMVRATLPSAMSPATVQGALALNAEITRQATMVAYVDDFKLMAVLALLCMPLILLMRQPRRKAAAGDEPPLEIAHA